MDDSISSKEASYEIALAQLKVVELEFEKLCNNLETISNYRGIDRVKNYFNETKRDSLSLIGRGLSKDFARTLQAFDLL